MDAEFFCNAGKHGVPPPDNVHHRMGTQPVYLFCIVGFEIVR